MISPFDPALGASRSYLSLRPSPWRTCGARCAAWSSSSLHATGLTSLCQHWAHWKHWLFLSICPPVCRVWASRHMINPQRGKSQPMLTSVQVLVTYFGHSVGLLAPLEENKWTGTWYMLTCLMSSKWRLVSIWWLCLTLLISSGYPPIMYIHMVACGPDDGLGQLLKAEQVFWEFPWEAEARSSGSGQRHAVHQVARPQDHDAPGSCGLWRHSKTSHLRLGTPDFCVTVGVPFSLLMGSWWQCGPRVTVNTTWERSGLEAQVSNSASTLLICCDSGKS